MTAVFFTVYNAKLKEQMESLTQTRKSRPHKLPAEQKEHFIAFFLKRYPFTKKIKVGTNADRAYTARAKYRHDNVNRTILVSAYSYESLVICMHAAYVSRGF